MKEILAGNVRSNNKQQSTNSKSPSRVNKKKRIWLYQSATVENKRQRKNPNNSHRKRKDCWGSLVAQW